MKRKQGDGSDCWWMWCHQRSWSLRRSNMTQDPKENQQRAGSEKELSPCKEEEDGQ